MGSGDPMEAWKRSGEGLVRPHGWLVCDPMAHTKCSTKYPAEEEEEAGAGSACLARASSFFYKTAWPKRRRFGPGVLNFFLKTWLKTTSF